MKDWLKIAASRSVASRAFKLALIVGTILGTINHGDKFLQYFFDPMSMAIMDRDLLKFVITYAVPYCVSTYSSVQAIRNMQRQNVAA